ncbi:MAG: lipopolysaccharide kinase InaA family protein [Atribacterota bacterium]
MKVETLSPFPDIPKRLEIEGPVFAGGEGEVYFSRCGEFVVKIYHDQVLPRDKEDMLRRVLFLGKNLGEGSTLLCWPLALVRELEGKRKVGVVTKKVPRPPFRELADFIFSPREFKKAVEGKANWLQYLQVAHAIARTVAILHGKGCAHADLHFKNFLVDIRTGRSVLIDLDGLVVPGFLPPQVAGMMPFMAPEILIQRVSPSQKTDRHSLAVLIFHTLLFRNPLQPLICYDSEDQERDEKLGWGEKALFSEHPFDFRHRPRSLGIPLFQKGALSYTILTPPLQALVERSFIEGLFDPEKRPLSREWERTLFDSFFSLWRCSRCSQYFFYPYWRHFSLRRCPFCGKTIVSPYPLVGMVYEPKNGQVAVQKKQVVLGHGFQVVGKMFDERSKEVFGEIRFLDSKRAYVFRNFVPGGVMAFMPSSFGQRLEEGQEVVLFPGVVFDFGGWYLEVLEDGRSFS